MIVATLLLVRASLVFGCTYESSPAISLNKKSITYVPICIILNDQSLFYAEVKFDILTRIVLQGSFNAVSAANACGSNPLWFPNGCNFVPQGGISMYPGSGLGAGAPTNFYANVLGFPAIYRKRYAYIGGNQQTVQSVFPIVTLVIQVNGGNVEKVYWDDDCYFNEGKTSTTSSYTMLSCRPNAFGLLTNNATRAFGPSAPANTGFDSSLTVQACKTGLANQALPEGFCDLGIYVVWTGTSADGQQLGSAGQRFRRFRDYAMSNQYLTVSFQP